MKKFYIEEELFFVEKSRSPLFQDLKDLEFGRLTVLGYAGGTPNKKWFCRCQCGKIVKVRSSHLGSGATNSCGCFHSDIIKSVSITHGHSKGGNTTSTYNTWACMIQRCNNKNHANYHHYGGRGIKVCDSWLNSFETFLEDMGERPRGKTIERKENNKGYCKENCRWATQKEQCNNTRKNRFLIFNGQSKTIPQWSDETGISYNAIRFRIKRGWSVEEVLTTPLKS
jgi:hypothetical protein